MSFFPFSLVISSNVDLTPSVQTVFRESDYCTRTNSVQIGQLFAWTGRMLATMPWTWENESRHYGSLAVSCFARMCVFDREFELGLVISLRCSTLISGDVCRYSRQIYPRNKERSATNADQHYPVVSTEPEWLPCWLDLINIELVDMWCERFESPAQFPQPCYKP